MLTLNDIKKPVDSNLKEFDKLFREYMSSKVPLLNIITRYVLKTKGKQLRPILVFLSAKLCGNANDATNVAAIVVELMHTATLVHDDVVDDAHERRGFLSINALWKSKVAVLMGDYLLAKGLLISLNNDQFGLLKTLSEAVEKMSEGELLQLQKTRHLNTNENDYFEIIESKTASLIAACTKSGCQSVTKNEEDIEKMYHYGLNIGMAFQIKDDLFDYESTTITGKPKGNDIKEKKFTLPLIHALNVCGNKEKRKIKKLISNGANNSAIQEVIQFVKNNGGVEYARKTMNDYYQKAVDILITYPDSEFKTSLLHLSEYITQRKK